MDIKIERPKKTRLRLFKEFQYIDLIPYSIALLLLIGEVYLVYLFNRLPLYGI